MSAAEIGEVVFVTLRVALVATALVALPGTALGYALARGRFRGKALLETLVSLPMVLPPVAVGLVLLLALARDAWPGRLLERLLGEPVLLTWWAAALASGVMAFPLCVFGAARGFEAVPRRLEDVAATLGAGRARVFLRITLPLAARGILHGLAFAFARALGEFGATVLVAGNVPGRTQTLATAIYARIEEFRDRDALLLAGVSVLLALLTTGAARFLHGARPA